MNPDVKFVAPVDNAGPYTQAHLVCLFVLGGTGLRIGYLVGVV